MIRWIKRVTDWRECEPIDFALTAGMIVGFGLYLLNLYYASGR